MIFINCDSYMKLYPNCMHIIYIMSTWIRPDQFHCLFLGSDRSVFTAFGKLIGVALAEWQGATGKTSRHNHHCSYLVNLAMGAAKDNNRLSTHVRKLA